MVIEYIDNNGKTIQALVKTCRIHLPDKSFIVDKKDHKALDISKITKRPFSASSIKLVPAQANKVTIY